MVIHVFFGLIIRCLFSKPWPKIERKVTLSAGRFSQEKIHEIGPFWANSVDLKHPGLYFAKEAGLEFESKQFLDDKEEQDREVDLQNLRELKKGSSDGPDPDLLSPKFSRGDEVTASKRLTWTIPQPGNPKFRKDLMEGTSGVIEGRADLEPGPPQSGHQLAFRA